MMATRKKPVTVIMERVSHAYMDLLTAFDEDRLEAVRGADDFEKVRAEIADKACAIRALLDEVIQRWRLEELCTWSTPAAARPSIMDSIHERFGDLPEKSPDLKIVD